MFDRIEPTGEPDPADGGYNDPPQNFREITQQEFVGSIFFDSLPQGIFYRLIAPSKLPGEKYYLPVQFFHFSDGTGVGLAEDFGKLRFFLYGCKHNYRELSPTECLKRFIHHFGQCYHVYECIHCKHIHAVDSSD